MFDRDSAVRLYGTPEQVPPMRPVGIGALSFLYARDGLRRICWNGTELVRAIAWPIRDENWGTYPPEIVAEEVQQEGERFAASLRFSVAGGRLECALTLEAGADGLVRADLTMTPTGGAFATNRAGFTVLHPITGVAGAPLRVTHSDGVAEDTVFPRLISPGQPVMDIRGLEYGVGGATVDIGFDGEVFEMEDQRNWSDASYKTYCVPLVHPFTYRIESPVTQSVTLRLGGGAAVGATTSSSALTASATDGKAPEVGLALAPGWPSGGAAARAAVLQGGAAHLLVRVAADTDSAWLAECADLAARLGAGVDAEIVLPDRAPADTALADAAAALSAAGVRPARVLALPAGYLSSHQPSGPWPEGPTPNDVCAAARRHFPDAAIGGGMMTNFTEFNRCPPDPTLCDFVTHGGTAIVHAGDDLSVIETLEALPQIFESAEALAGGRPYRLGLMSIGMRSNPYGAAVAENPAQVRRTMAREDPRHRGLFGAAWAVGVLAATAGRGVEALCLAAPTGPFGIVHAPAAYPQSGYDDAADGTVYPLFHVVREAASMAGDGRLVFDGLPTGVSAHGVRRNDECRAMIANISPDPVTVGLPHPASARVLDVGSATDARAADWLDRTEPSACERLDLAPFGIAFVRWAQ